MPPEPCGRHGDPGGIAESGHHIEVIGDAFQFGVDHPDQPRPPGRVHPGQLLGGVRERQRVRDRGNALDAFGHQNPVCHR